MASKSRRTDKRRRRQLARKIARAKDAYARAFEKILFRDGNDFLKLFFKPSRRATHKAAAAEAGR